MVVVLIVISGLPGVGKSTVADALGQQLPATVVSVDPIEDAILRSGIQQSHETGLAAYEVGATIAEHQLRNGLQVVADAANYLDVGRQIWIEAARRAGSEALCIEVICSDTDLHRRRLEHRTRGLSEYPEPTWGDVVRRMAETEPWRTPVLRLDTVRPIDELVALAIQEVVP